MKAFVYHIALQWKLDIRNRNVLLPYYIIPIVFFFVMSSVFTSIMPDYGNVLIPAMISFSVTMAAILGMPIPLHEIYGSDIKKMYYLGNVPLYIPLLVSMVTSFIHFVTVSVVILVFGSVIYDGVLVVGTGQFILYVLIFILANIGIGSMIGLYAKNTSSMVLMGQAIFLPSILFSGAMFPTDMLPQVMQYGTYIFPASLGMKIATETEHVIGLFIALFLVFVICIILSIRKAVRLISNNDI